jgi:hypothetical protein
VERLVADGKYLEAAQEVRDGVNEQTFASSLRRLLSDPHFESSEIHGDLLTLDQPLVVNLNYDRIYENHCMAFDPDQYVVSHYYTDDIIRNIRSPLRVILKLHGSVDDPKRVVFSVTDYQRIKPQNQTVFAILDAVLKTRTVLFLGCGFNGDPDVENLLTETALQMDGGYPHFALVPARDNKTAYERAKAKGLNIDFIEYQVDHNGDPHSRHALFRLAVKELTRAVVDSRGVSV